jgi:hypothetical protein
MRNLVRLLTNCRIDLGLAAVLALLVGLIFGMFAGVTVDPHHDGIMLKPAMDVLSGQMLFRDTFSQYGPLTTYLQALALTISPTLMSLRLLTVFAYAGSLFLFYLAWRVLLPRSLTIIASLFFIIYAPFYDPYWPMLPWSSALAMVFQATGFLAMMRLVAGEKPAAVWAWTLGASCACTLWCRQPVGIILIGSAGVIAIALHVAGWRHPDSSSGRIWTRAGAGFGVVSLLILGYLTMNGALGAWWEQNILWPRRWAAVADDGMFSYFSCQYLVPQRGFILAGLFLAGLAPAIIRRFWPKFPAWVGIAWIPMLAVVYMAGARSVVRTHLLIPDGGWNVLIVVLFAMQGLLVVIPLVWRRTSPKAPDYYLLAALTGLVLGSAAQIYPVPCADHNYWALAPGLGVFVYICWRWTRMETWSCSLLMLLFLMPAAYDKYRWGKYTLELSSVTLERPAVLKGMQVAPDFAAAVRRIDDVLRPLLEENPDRRVLLYGNDALYLEWFRNRDNPSPYYVDWAGLITEDDWYSRLGYVVKNRPVLLVHRKVYTKAESFLRVMGYEIVHEEPSLALLIALPIKGASPLPWDQVPAMPADSQ